MAKGDNSALQSTINNQTQKSEQALGAASANQQQLYGNMYNNYGSGVSRNLPTYDTVMGSYGNFLNGSLGYPTQNSGAQAPNVGNRSVPSSPLSGFDTNQWIGQPMNSGQFPGGISPFPANYSGPSSGGSPSGSIATWAGGTGKLQGYTGPTNPLDPSQYAQMTADLGVGNDRDPNQINTLKQRLTAAGYNVQDGPISGNQQDSLIINGQLTRLFDSSGRWNPQADTADKPAWDMPGQGGMNPNSAMGGWENMAQTGGFSPQDIQDFRARSVAPIRSMYQGAQDELNRGKELAGGYMPNLGASQAKLAREQGYASSDAMTNADAAIAQLVQQGKLYGLTGETNAQLGALAGMTSMYGANPALSSTFGNQVLGASGQGLTAAGIQNDIGRTAVSGQGTLAQQPGALSRLFPGGVPSMLQSAGQAGPAIANMFGSGGPGNYQSIGPGQGFGGPGTSTYGGSQYGIPQDGMLPSSTPTYGYTGITPGDTSWSNLADPSMDYYNPNSGGIWNNQYTWMPGGM